MNWVWVLIFSLFRSFINEFVSFWNFLVQEDLIFLTQLVFMGFGLRLLLRPQDFCWQVWAASVLFTSRQNEPQTGSNVLENSLCHGENKGDKFMRTQMLNVVSRQDLVFLAKKKVLSLRKLNNLLFFSEVSWLKQEKKCQKFKGKTSFEYFSSFSPFRYFNRLLEVSFICLF